MSDEGSTGGDLFGIPAGGGERRNLTPNLKASVTSFRWLSSDSILLSEVVAGDDAFVQLGVGDGSMQTLWRGAEGIQWSFASGKSGVVRSACRKPPEGWTGPIGNWKQLTQVNTMAIPWGEGQSVHWHSDDFDVQGWLLGPANVDPNKKYPLVVSIHGGPASAALASFPREQNAALAAAGYFVFMANPRGSYGQGEAFTRANVKDFGGGDLRDILAGVDAVLKEHPMIDANRVGVWGWSYGGFMTMWTVTQTNRFRAAVAGAGVANWQSYYGENDIDEWMIPYFGATVYDDPAVYAKSAPITFIKSVQTPTLVLVGERDGECPAPQSFEFWHALKSLGVDTQLVVYADEGHSIRKLEHRRDIAHRIVQWFDSHMK